MINQNWPRWVRSSCTKYFADRISTNLFFYPEGTDRRTPEYRTYCEFRIDGPDIKEISSGYWHLDVAINLLVVTSRNDSDIYEHDRNVGLVASVFTSGIPVWQYGNGPDDDPTVQLGCLLLKAQEKELVVISNYGVVANDSRMIQSTVEGHYRLNLRP